MLRLDSLSLPLDFTPETLNALILRKLKCPPEQLKSVVPLKKAVDARDKADVHFVLSVAVTLKDEAKVLAAPSAMACPWPRGPDVFSTPCSTSTSGWPGVTLPHCRRLRKSSTE